MRRGFTLIELLVTMVILVVIGSFGVAVSERTFLRGAIDSERDALQGALVRARSEAMANSNQSPHGVAVTDDGYVVFQGASYAGRDPDFDAVVPRAREFAITGPSEVVFQALDGRVTAPGEFVIQSDIKSLTVAVNEEGRIEW